MLKKYLILLIMFFICYNIHGKLDNKFLKEQILTSDIIFEDITLEEALSIISKESGSSFIPNNDTKDIFLDITIPSGESMENVINTILEIYNLKISSVGKIFLVSQKNTLKENFTLFGKITSKGYNYGVDNVKITITNSSYPSIYSKYGGNFIIPEIEPGVYIVKFEKPGYISKCELINLNQSSTELNICLEKNNSYSNHKTTNQKNIKFNTNSIVSKKVILNNTDTEEIEKVLAKTYGDSLKVSSLKKQSMIILSGDFKTIENALALIKEIDQHIQQVRISSQILDISNNLFEHLGFEWIFSHGSNNNQNNNLDFSLLSSSKIAGIGNIYSSGINITRKFNSGHDVLNLGINLLQSTQDLIVSAKPSILVVNGENGEFKLTEEVIVGEKKNENTNNDNITYTPIFKEAGIILKVTPHIKENGYIVLNILIEVSNFKLKYNKDGGPDSGTFNAEGGSKVGRSIKTTIKMKDGDTIFIGGLKKAMIHNLDSQVPFFGTLPMLKFLFKNEGISHEMTDIYIKLKVDIVDNTTTNFDKDELHKRIENITNNRIY